MIVTFNPAAEVAVVHRGGAATWHSRRRPRRFEVRDGDFWQVIAPEVPGAPVVTDRHHVVVLPGEFVECRSVVA
jgi:hypothetical protein